MPETDASIRISAIGGDEAASAIAKSTEGLENLGNASGQLEERFSHRFSHIGLQLFASDLLRANGLGAETRQVVGTLNMAIMAAGSAFGEAAIPIMLVGTALAALVGIYEKVHEHSEKHIAELDKLRKGNEETITSTDKSIESLEHYRQELGSLPGYLQDVLSAQIKLRDATLETQIAIDKQLLPTLEEKTTKEREDAEALQLSLTKQEEAVKHLNVIKQGMQGYPMLVAEREKLEELTMAYHKADTQYATDNAKLATVRAEIIEYEQKITQTVKDRADAIQKTADAAQTAADKETAAFQHAAEEREKMLQHQAEEETKHYQDLAEKHAKEMDIIGAKEKEVWKSIHEAGITAVEGISKTLADSFTKMIFEGKDLMDSLKQGFKQLTEQIVADIIKWEIEMQVFKAMSGGAMGGGGGFDMFAQHFAAGGSFVASQATPIIVGEGGQPELVTITPFSQLGLNGNGGGSGGGGGSTVNIGSIQTVVNEASDADQIADQVGLKIAQRIRGQGEINFTRSS